MEESMGYKLRVYIVRTVRMLGAFFINLGIVLQRSSVGLEHLFGLTTLVYHNEELDWSRNWGPRVACVRNLIAPPLTHARYYFAGCIDRMKQPAEALGLMVPGLAYNQRTAGGTVSPPEAETMIAIGEQATPENPLTYVLTHHKGKGDCLAEKLACGPDAEITYPALRHAFAEQEAQWMAFVTAPSIRKKIAEGAVRVRVGYYHKHTQGLDLQTLH